MVYEDNIRAAAAEIASSEHRKADLLFWLKNKTVVPNQLRAILDKHMLIEEDIRRLAKEVEKQNPQVQPEPEPVPLIKHEEKIREPLKIDVSRIQISKKKRTTGVWRRTEGSEHIYAVKWVRRSKLREGMGTLFVAFATGGETQGGRLPIYVYRPVTYGEYYDMWKARRSAGSFAYWVLQHRSYRKAGHLSRGEVE